MARYVLLRFSSNEDAEVFTKAIETGQIFMGKEHSKWPGQYNVIRPYDDYDTVGVFAAPTKFCDCQVKSDKSARSKNYGWWVCTTCHKPRAGNFQHPHNLIDDRRGYDRPTYIGIREPWKLKED